MTLGNTGLLDDKDETLLETLRQDICIGRKNVLVMSEEEFYLDAIFLRLYNELKDTDGLAVHRMFQPDVEGIVGWFNKLLAEVSIDEARNLNDQPKTIIFMPEVTHSSIQDWISCESLIGAFPGANVSLIAFGRTDKINPPTVANIAAKRQNSVVKLPQLSLERVEHFFRDAKKNGELSVVMSALIDSPFRELALTIQDEVETEVEAINDDIDQLNPASLEEFGIDDPKKLDRAVNLSSDNEADLNRNEHGGPKRFVMTTALFFIAFMFILFTVEFLYGSNQGVLINQSVIAWLEWLLSTLGQLVSWGVSFVERILSTI